MNFKLRQMGGGTSHNNRASAGKSGSSKIQSFFFNESGSKEKTETLTEDEVKEELKEDFKRVPLGAFYRGIMFLLVPIIVCIIAIYFVAAGALGWVAYDYFNQFTIARADGAQWQELTLKGTVSALAAIFFILLLRPLVSSLFPHKMRVITQEEEPILHSYVNNLCAKLGANPPTEICVDMAVNASVSYRRGFFSLFTDSTRLTIGLPLIEGMSLKQLSGILCHEIGHFTQGNARKVSYILLHSYGWLATSCLTKRGLEKLVSKLYEPERSIILKIPGRLLWLLFLIPKIIFGILAFIVYLTCMFLMRQMEYNADLYEAQAAGSDNFESTSLELTMLSVSQSITIDGLQRSFQNKRLSDDIPGLIAASRVIISEEEKNKIHKSMMKAKGSIADTHPATVKRVKNAKKYNYPGIITSEVPARRLLQNLESYNKELTKVFYLQYIGKRHLKNVSILPSDDLLIEMRETYRGWRVLNSFFQGVLHFSIPYQFKGSTLYSSDREFCTETLKNCRKQMELQQNAARDAQKRFLENSKDKSRNSIARKLLTIKMPEYASLIMDQWVDPGTMTRIESELRKEMGKVKETLDDYYDIAKKRIENAIQLLNMDEFRSEMKHGEACVNNLQPILANLQIMQSIQLPMTNLANNINALGLLFAVGGQSEKFIRNLFKLHDFIESGLFNMRNTLSKIEYPFEHSQENISLADFSVEKMPERDDLLGMYYTSIEMYDRISSLYFRILGQLISIVEQVELAAGLEPLPKYKPLFEDEDGEDDE